MIKDKLNGILDKIENNAEGIGGLLGIMSDPIHSHGISVEALEFMLDRLGKWHVPDPLNTIKNMLAMPDAYPVMTNITAALGGWALAEFGSTIDPKVAKLGRIVKKAGFAGAIGNMIGAFLWLPGSEPTASQGLTTSPMGQYSV